MADFRQKILYVEDDVEAAAILAEELTDRGYEMCVVHDGRLALRRALKFMPDLIICDIGLPQMSGFEVLEQLAAAAPGFEGVPFIFLTALGDRESELKGRRLGADDYLVKPFDFDVLCELIRKRMSVYARIKICPEATQLSKRETDVLTLAARGKNSAEIADELGCTKRTVDFHIDNAREKLGAATRIQAAAKAASFGLIEP